MAANTKGLLDGYLATFHSSLASADYNAAEVALLSAQACLQALPDTENASYREAVGMDRLFDRLYKIRDRANAVYVKAYAGGRNKRRSTQ